LARIEGYEKCAHLYDLFDTKENIGFFLGYAREAGEILDLGAGTGRIAIPIARAGIDVYCVEPSAAMRREFAKKLEGHPELTSRIRILKGDAATFRFNRVFPAAFMSGSFDHLLDDDERSKALANTANHLVAGGKLVFDVFVGLMADGPLVPAGEIGVGDKLYRRSIARKVLPRDRIEVTLVFETYAAGRLIERIEETSLAGMVDRSGVNRLLGEAGFRVDKEFRGYDKSPYRQGDEILIVEASRSP
jgi:SAM-dependent methyltransferase